MIKALLAEGVDTIFGYPGGAILPVYDSLYDYTDRISHILTRHEQGAIHAAQGYARVSGRPGVVIVTSGPGAANVITGLSDAMMDSTPVVVISGQVGARYLGSDAFQETDVVAITQPITKWAVQVRRAEDIALSILHRQGVRVPSSSTSPKTPRSDSPKKATGRSTSYAAIIRIQRSTMCSSPRPHG